MYYIVPPNIPRNIINLPQPQSQPQQQPQQQQQPSLNNNNSGLSAGGEGSGSSMTLGVVGWRGRLGIVDDVGGRRLAGKDRERPSQYIFTNLYIYNIYI